MGCAAFPVLGTRLGQTQFLGSLSPDTHVTAALRGSIVHGPAGGSQDTCRHQHKQLSADVLRCHRTETMRDGTLCLSVLAVGACPVRLCVGNAKAMIIVSFLCKFNPDSLELQCYIMRIHVHTYIYI